MISYLMNCQPRCNIYGKRCQCDPQNTRNNFDFKKFRILKINTKLNLIKAYIDIFMPGHVIHVGCEF